MSTDFVRGKKAVTKQIKKKDQDEKLISTKRIEFKSLSTVSDNNKKKSNGVKKGVKRGIKTENDPEVENNSEDEDKDLFSNPYTKLKNIKKKKLDPSQSASDQSVSNFENLSKDEIKSIIKDPSKSLSAKEEADARRLLPFIKKNTPTSATRLMKNDIRTGMVVLASVESITEIDVTLSLPFGMKGYVKFNEISDQFTEWMKSVLADKSGDYSSKSNFRTLKQISDKVRDMLIKGQLIKCGIVGLTDNPNKVGLHCTLRPEIVNKGSEFETFVEGMNIYGVINSVEDKGYVVSFGSELNFKGFLEFKDTAYYWPSNPSEQLTQFSVGQPLELNIKKMIKDTKTIHLSASHHLVSRAVVSNSNVVTMESIQAGMLVETKVLEVLPNGLHLGFLEFFTGDIFIIHTQKSLDSYKSGQGVKARIIFVDQIGKRIGLSNLNHILGFKPFPFGIVKPGYFYPGGKIDTVAPLEMILSLKDQQQSQQQQQLKAYIHFHEIEAKSNTLTSQYKDGQQFERQCRVKHLDYLDGMVTITSLPKELAKVFYSYFDVSSGMILDGRIKNIRDDSLELELAPGINGVVPKNNMAEILISKPREMFKHNQIVKCRVLSVDPEKKRLILTLKKSIINTDYPLLLTRPPIVPGLISHGTVTKIAGPFAFVSFFNTVFGKVHFSQIVSTPIKDVDISKHLSIGQVVLARVLDNPVGAPLKLSLVITPNDIKQYQSLLSTLNLNLQQQQQQYTIKTENVEDIKVKEEPEDDDVEIKDSEQVDDDDKDNDDDVEEVEEIEVKEEESEEEEEKIPVKKNQGKKQQQEKPVKQQQQQNGTKDKKKTPMSIDKKETTTKGSSTKTKKNKK
eukprot:gene4213-5276_t